MSVVHAPLAGPNEVETLSSLPVKADRKATLLLEARAERIAWVQSIPLPYARSHEEPATVFHATHALQQVPSASRVLSALYGEGEGISKEDIDERVVSLLEKMGENTKEHHKLAVPTGTQILQNELSNAEGSLEDVLRAYRGFLTKLQLPECASLVQGMRGFLRTLRGSGQDSMANAIRAYIDMTVETLGTYPAFKNTDVKNVKRSLESFVFGQGKDMIWSTIDVSQDDINFQRWQSLQFVTPEHLDIPCLVGLSPEEFDGLLNESITALLSVEKFFSPFEKLQCILKAYRGINTALSMALNYDNSATKLPSADDILPTLILMVLRARPRAIASNLAMIEMFCTPAQLRGEAGYAFTNLYGAVQFLLDLDLKKDPEKLTISAQDFRKGLEACRAQAEDNLSKMIEIEADTKQALPLWKDVTIPVTEIRAARLGGEVIDINWAKQWYEAKGHIVTSGGESTGPDDIPESLLPGFTRSYTFLTTRPDEIRVVDLPQLLAEYRMLVHTTEVLLSERSSRQSLERKLKFAEEQRRLEDEALEVELGLELKKNKRANSDNL